VGVRVKVGVAAVGVGVASANLVETGRGVLVALEVGVSFGVDIDSVPDAGVRVGISMLAVSPGSGLQAVRVNKLASRSNKHTAFVLWFMGIIYLTILFLLLEATFFL
jgi:hypothetical protein